MNIIVLIFNNIITNYILLDYYHQCSNKNIDSSIEKKSYLLYASITALSILVNLLSNTLLNIVFYITITLFLTFRVYKQKAIALIQNILFLIFLILIEYICYYSYTFAINYFLTPQASEIITYIDTITSTFLILLFYYFNRTLLWKMRFNHLTKQERALLLIIPIFSLFICLAGSMLARYIHEPLIEYIFFVMIASTIILNITVYEVVLSFSNYNLIKTEVSLHAQERKFWYMYYTNREKQTNELKHMEHDYVRHLNMLNSLLNENKSKDAKKYLASIIANVNERVTITFSRNTLLDMLLQEKAALMEKEGISYKFDVLVSSLSWVDDFDIITIFSNLLDNAIEANEIVCNNKYINLEIKPKGSNFIIKLENSCLSKNALGSPYTTSTKEGHSGYGLQNIIKSVERYHGMFDINITKHTCVCQIILPYQ